MIILLLALYNHCILQKTQPLKCLIKQSKYGFERNQVIKANFDKVRLSVKNGINWAHVSDHSLFNS